MEENRKNVFLESDGDGIDFLIPENNDEFNYTPEEASGGRELEEDSVVETTIPMDDKEYENMENQFSEGDGLNSLFCAVEVSRENLPDDAVISRSEIACKREATELEKLQQERSNKMVIESFEITKEFVDEGLKKLEETGLGAERVRTYKNKAVYKKSKFAKAQESTENPMKKIIIMVVFALAGGIIGGLQANSYYIMQKGKVSGVLNCAFSWLLSVDDVSIKIAPFYVDIFFGAFFIWFGLLAVVLLFSYFNSKTLKSSRVGHEHGNAKLMDNKSFNKYKNRFMEG